MAIEIQMNQEVRTIMEGRHILEEDIRSVVEWAESSGVKLYQPGTEMYLAKRTIQNATFYAKYSYTPPRYTIHSAYMHRSVLVEG
jgi:hypothetical protein